MRALFLCTQQIILDSRNCANPAADGGSLLLDAPATSPSYQPPLVPPASFGYVPKCWHTENFLSVPMTVPGKHLLVFCSLTDGFNLQYMDL